MPFRNWEGPPGSKKSGPQAYSCKKISSANNLSELGSRFFPNQASRWEYSPADTFIAAVWDPEPRIQQSQTLDPQKLWINKCMLVRPLRFVTFLLCSNKSLMHSFIPLGSLSVMDSPIDTAGRYTDGHLRRPPKALKDGSRVSGFVGRWRTSRGLKLFSKQKSWVFSFTGKAFGCWLYNCFPK